MKDIGFFGSPNLAENIDAVTVEGLALQATKCPYVGSANNEMPPLTIFDTMQESRRWAGLLT